MFSKFINTYPPPPPPLKKKREYICKEHITNGRGCTCNIFKTSTVKLWGALKQDFSICISFSLRRRPHEAQECEQHRWISWSHNLLASRLYLLLLYCAFALVSLIPGFCFCNCFYFCSLQVPLMSCATPRRAGETKNGASPNYCHYYVTKLLVAFWVKEPAGIIPESHI